MSNKIYIGTEEIGGSGGSADLTNYYNKSHIDSSYGVIDASLKYLDASVKELASRPSGGDMSGYVDVSTWDEHEKVIASTLVYLNTLEEEIEKFDEAIQAQEDALLAEVHVVEQTKADASTVYTKSDIDKSDKVVSQALMVLHERVSSIETSIGSGGNEFDPTYLENAILDVSNMVDVAGNLALDVSARVDALENIEYVNILVLDASINEFTYSKLHIDASFAEIASGSSSTPSGNFLEYFEVNETGFFFVDASLNIGVSIDSSGLHAPNLVEYNEIN